VEFAGGKPWMRRIGLLAAGGGLLVALLARPRPLAESPTVVRAALRLPDPGREESLAYLFDRMRSGEELELDDLRPALWRLVGQIGLQTAGADAAAYLFDEARDSAYRNDPALLNNVLSLLPSFPAALEHERLAPFLLRSAEAARAPEGGPPAEYAGTILRRVLEVFLVAPDPRAAPLCEEQLASPAPGADLRAEALEILVRLRRSEPLLRALPKLPPNDAEPDGRLRLMLLDRLFASADPGAGPEANAFARAFEPALRASLASALPLERLRAAAALLRLGDEPMAARLVDEHARAKGDDLVASTALELLARARQHPYAHDRLLEHYRDESARPPAERTGWFHTSLAILAAHWPRDPEVVAALRRHLDARDTAERFLVPQLAEIDRGDVVARLRAEIESGDPGRLRSAVDAATAASLPETGPSILAVARRERDDATRAYLFAALARFRTEGADGLFADALDPSRSDLLRAVAASCLLDFGSSEGRRLVAASLDSGDRAVLDAMVRRAVAQGVGAAPPETIPSLLRIVRRASSEAARRGALLVLRLQGDLAAVRDDLLDAYRREPSARVAEEIAATLRDLAHR